MARNNTTPLLRLAGELRTAERQVAMYEKMLAAAVEFDPSCYEAERMRANIVEFEGVCAGMRRQLFHLGFDASAVRPADRWIRIDR